VEEIDAAEDTVTLVIVSQGGNILMADGKIVGVSGGSGSQDNIVSLAGQAAPE
jgi:glc operon protein GlcG